MESTLSVALYLRLGVPIPASIRVFPSVQTVDIIVIGDIYYRKLNAVFLPTEVRSARTGIEFSDGMNATKEHLLPDS